MTLSPGKDHGLALWKKSFYFQTSQERKVTSRVTQLVLSSAPLLRTLAPSYDKMKDIALEFSSSPIITDNNAWITQKLSWNRHL